MSETALWCLRCKGHYTSRSHVCALGGCCRNGKHAGFCHDCLKKEVDEAIKGFEKQFPQSNNQGREKPAPNKRWMPFPFFNQPRFKGRGEGS